VYEPREHQITGYPDEVASALRLARVQERLLSDPAIIRNTVVRHPDGRVSVQARMLTAQAPPRRTHPVAREVTRSLVLASLFVAASAVVMAGVVYALLTLLRHAIAAVHWGPVLTGALVVLLILWIIRVVTSGHACRGIHCDGCSRR
jgi:hypothetical protein